MDKLVEAILAKPDTKVTDPQDGEFPDCSVFMNSFSKCLAMGYQQDYLYRHGSYEDCSLNFDDWKACMHSRLIHDSEKKKVLRICQLLLLMYRMVLFSILFCCF
ncbi:DUF3128 domain-containing protein [archaeon]|nr:MAG: DUF3128 domain-containing protein [archaeon]